VEEKTSLVRFRVEGERKGGADGCGGKRWVWSRDKAEEEGSCGGVVEPGVFVEDSEGRGARSPREEEGDREKIKDEGVRPGGLGPRRDEERMGLRGREEDGPEREERAQGGCCFYLFIYLKPFLFAKLFLPLL
jgi:hypothetical protein